MICRWHRVLQEAPPLAPSTHVGTCGRGRAADCELAARGQTAASTEGAAAPGGQGATTERYWPYAREEQRRPPGCRGGRMPPQFGHGLLAKLRLKPPRHRYGGGLRFARPLSVCPAPRGRHLPRTGETCFIRYDVGLGRCLVVSSGEEDRSMRACGPRADIAIKIEVETRIEFQTIPVHVDDMDLVVAFRLHHTAWCQVFDEKVIRHHETFLVARELQIMWPRARAEIHDTQDLRMVRTRDVEHDDFTCAVERDKQA